MKAYLYLAAGLAVIAAPAGAVTIASEDFEAGASGWTNNFTSDPGPNSGGFTRHLGRGGAGATSSKTFALGGGPRTVTVAFDWYRLDSWDGETFTATANDGVTSTSTSRIGFFNDGGPTNIYNPNWSDRIERISFSFTTNATSFTLGFDSTLDQDFTDESWGVDNLLITDNTRTVVPEPATWAMMIGGFGLVGAASRRRTTKAITV